jgi:hypothetical protein
VIDVSVSEIASPGSKGPGGPLILQEVEGGCFIWEKRPHGYEKLDFFDDLTHARDAYPEATQEALPPQILEELT